MKITSPITNFDKLLAAVEENDIREQTLLPITHIPHSFFISDIIETGLLKTNSGSNHFPREKLLFFFYGRNYYMPTLKKGLENDPYPPFVFLFDINTIKKYPKRMLPFDSGGFKKYKMNKSLKPVNFQMKCSCTDDIKKLVFVLYNFKGHQGYLNFEDNFDELINKLPFFQAINELHLSYKRQAKDSTIVGKQGRSIELQYAEALHCDPTIILYPTTFNTDDDAIRQIKNAFKKAKHKAYIPDGNPNVTLDRINTEIKRMFFK